MQFYLLSSSPESNIFTDAASVNECLDVLERFTDTTLEPVCSPWSYVDGFDDDEVFGAQVTNYKEIRVAAAAIEEYFDVSAPFVMCVQSSNPAQPPMIYVSKVRL